MRADPDDALAKRLESLGVRDADLDERFIRASGPGGQHVNKTSTCVVLRHRPTGIEVRCQDERSQAMNRMRARLRLAEALEARRRAAHHALAHHAAVSRARRRRRSPGGQRQVLEGKRRRARKKSLRARPGREALE